jgi:ATP-dependent RNA helicase DeaD
MKTEAFKLSKNTISLLEKNGIITATAIQKKIIPAIMGGRDVLAQSETGSGKTISFAVPIIEQIEQKDNLCALVLVPTRELCTQVTNEFIKFAEGKRLGITAVYGGVSIDNQIRKLKKTNIIIATPGRLIDLIDRRTVHLDKVKFLVFDEADRMLDMGFIHDIEKILKHLTHKLQTMLFSATVSKEITELSKKYLFNPVHVILESSVDPEFLQQTYYQTTNDQKMSLLIHLLKQERDLSLVFCNRKHITSKLADKLTKFGIQAKCLHGDMSQSQRERVTADFRHKRFNILIATDVASRGLHIEDITHVYNYEIPKDVDSYTHRVGRTARAGKKGEAISLVTKGEDQKFFKQILFNYRGSITLKEVDTALLPKIESTASDKRRGKEQNRSRDEKPFGRTDKSKSWGKDNSGSFRKDKKKSFGDNEKRNWGDEKPKSFSRDKSKTFGENKSKDTGDNNFRPFRGDRKKAFGGDKPKSWSDDKPKSFRDDKKKSFGSDKHKSWSDDKPKSFRDDKKKSFGSDKPKTWTKEKPLFSGKRKFDSWDNPISLIWGENKKDSSDKRKTNSSSDDKSNLKGKNKPGFFEKKKSKSWEDRKPKFWSEGKSNKRLKKK